MYNIKGPSKIVAKTTRRGISQNIESYRENISKNKSVDANDNEIMNGPKPTFNNCSKRIVMHNSYQQDVITPQQEEIIKYIHDSWMSLNLNTQEFQQLPDSVQEQNDTSMLYYKDGPRPLLKDFKPFDLESWWGKRLYQFITNSVNNKN